MLKSLKKMLFCVGCIASLLTGQIIGSTITVAVALVIFLALLGLQCWKNFTLPILLFFLPWSPLMKLAPGTVSVYTVGLMMACCISIARNNFRMQKEYLLLALPIVAITLCARLVRVDGLSPNYFSFLMMIFLFPGIQRETKKGRYDFRCTAVFMSVGIILAALCAQQFAMYPNIKKYIVSYSYLTITRWSGFYEDPNFYSAQITAALGAILLLILKGSGKQVVPMALMAVLLVYCGLLSGSKSFILILALILILWMVLLIRMRRKSSMKVQIYGLLLLVAVFVASSTVFQNLWQIMVTRFLLDDKTLSGLTTGRTEIWINYLRSFGQDMLTLVLGNGMINRLVNGKASHNSLIQMVFQLGIFGSALMIMWIWYFLQKPSLRRIQRQGNLWECLILISGAFLPWMALDVMFFDEFFLFQWFVLQGMQELLGENTQIAIKNKNRDILNKEVVSVNEIDMRHTSNEAGNIALKSVLSAAMKKSWLIALVALLCAGAVFLYTFLLVTPQYEATVKFYVNNSSVSVGGTSISISSSDLTVSRNLVDSCIVILETRETLKNVIDYAGVDMDYENLLEVISAEAVDSTEIFRVTVTLPDPQNAEKIANAVAFILPKRIATVMEGTAAKVVEAAIVPTDCSAPSYVNNTIMGALLGLILAFAFVAVEEITDNTIRTEDDVKQACRYPVLASIPNMAATGKRDYGYDREWKVEKASGALVGTDISWGAAEAYKRLRTKLRFSVAGDEGSRVIGVTSSLSGEGKSLSSVNLAYSLSELGKRVILIDCDMRRPTVDKKLQIKRIPGISSYLNGRCELKTLVQPCDIDGKWDAFHVITAGKRTSTPNELLSSARMHNALMALRAEYDYIILDLPPVSEVSDAMTIAEKTDGILMVVREHYCDRKILIDSVEQLEYVNASILGIVLNCSSEANGKCKNKFRRRLGRGIVLGIKKWNHSEQEVEYEEKMTQIGIATDVDE